jgi:hypothetical protein
VDAEQARRFNEVQVVLERARDHRDSIYKTLYQMSDSTTPPNHSGSTLCPGP